MCRGSNLDLGGLWRAFLELLAVLRLPADSRITAQLGTSFSKTDCRVQRAGIVIGRLRRETLLQRLEVALQRRAAAVFSARGL